GDPAVEGEVSVRSVVDDAAELPECLELTSELPDVAALRPRGRVLVREVAIVVANTAGGRRKGGHAVDDHPGESLGMVVALVDSLQSERLDGLVAEDRLGSGLLVAVDDIVAVPSHPDGVNAVVREQVRVRDDRLAMVAQPRPDERRQP